MNKLTAAFFLLLLMANVVRAQGTVLWTNFFSSIKAQTNSTQLSPFFGGGSTTGGVGYLANGSTGSKFYFALLYSAFAGTNISAPTTLGQLSTWQFTGLMATNANSGTASPVNPSFAATVPWAGGTTNNNLLAGWSANLGNSWASVSNLLFNFNLADNNSYFFGVSPAGYLKAGTGTPGTTLFGSIPTANGLPINAVNMQLYSIPTPEPGTVVLFGAGGLMLFARQISRRTMRLEKSAGGKRN